MLTAHQVIALRRLLPDATIECREDEAMVEFRDGDAAGAERIDGDVEFWMEMREGPNSRRGEAALREVLGGAG